MKTEPSAKFISLAEQQEGLCFFCNDPLPANSNIDHLDPRSHKGGNCQTNCVACCLDVNRELGNISLKEKMQLFVYFKGAIPCPRKSNALKNRLEEKGKGKVLSKVSLIEMSSVYAVIDLIAKRRLAPAPSANLPKRRKGLKNLLKTQYKLSDVLSEKCILKLEERGIIKLNETVVEWLQPKKRK